MNDSGLKDLSNQLKEKSQTQKKPLSVDVAKKQEIGTFRKAIVSNIVTYIVLYIGCNVMIYLKYGKFNLLFALVIISLMGLVHFLYILITNYEKPKFYKRWTINKLLNNGFKKEIINDYNGLIGIYKDYPLRIFIEWGNNRCYRCENTLTFYFYFKEIPDFDITKLQNKNLWDSISKNRWEYIWDNGVLKLYVGFNIFLTEYQILMTYLFDAVNDIKKNNFKPLFFEELKDLELLNPDKFLPKNFINDKK